jgi:uncharacterized protein YjbI with pentapeptide repeats
MEGQFLNQFWEPVTQWLGAIPWDQGDDWIAALTKLKDAFQEHAPKIKHLEPYFEQLKPFIDLLDSPIIQLATDSVPLLTLSINLFKAYLQQGQPAPTFQSAVLLVAQLAYLESLQSATQKWALQNPALLTLLESIAFGPILKDQIAQLNTLDISWTDARNALYEFSYSRIAQRLNATLTEQLKQIPLNPEEIQILVTQVSWGTGRCFPKYLAATELKELVEPLAEFLRQGGGVGADRETSLDAYLKAESERFCESASLKDMGVAVQDLYVELNVKPLDQHGNPLRLSPQSLEELPPVNIHGWVQQRLQPSSENRRVLFIQGEAGRGKSVFCQMFAQWLRKSSYLAYIPIVLRLRDLKRVEANLQDTLSNLLSNEDFVCSDPGWLTDRNRNFLLILDGFDELALQGQSTQELRDFLRQVEQFQKGRHHHQLLITGRPLALHNLEEMIADMNFVRARLEPMNDRQREQWLTKWAQKVGQLEADQLQAFLAACPEEIEDRLAREPLLLFLLGCLHQEGKLQISMFEDTQDIDARVLIYDRSIVRVLEERQKDSQTHPTSLAPEDLRVVLQETALCVMQSGGESAPFRAIQSRFNASDNPIAKHWEAANTALGNNEPDRALNNWLTTFYFQPGKEAPHGGSVEFIHKSFSEFLCAERLAYALEDWTELDTNRQRFYRSADRISDHELAWQIYDLLGHGAITAEIMDYLRAMLFKRPQLDISRLFDRLYRFYLGWSEGIFIDQPALENLPQRKMQQLTDMSVTCGLRQIDVYAGLNVMILLFELHKYNQQHPLATATPIVFRPDGEPGDDLAIPQKLRRIIGYSECLDPNAFADIVGFALSHADLSHARLNSVRLTSADLQEANLERAQLINAFLSSANLRRANLHCAQLSSAELFNANLVQTNLSQAVLYGATLSGANLSLANLANAELFRAILSKADLTRADLTHTKLTDAQLRCAKLTSANLSKARLERANLSEAELDRANLGGADLYKANLSNANLCGANLEGAKLNRAILYQANLSNANLCGANLEGAKLNRANLSQADLQDVRWNQETEWPEMLGLEQAKNLAGDLKQHLDTLKYPRKLG